LKEEEGAQLGERRTPEPAEKEGEKRKKKLRATPDKRKEFTRQRV